MFEIQLHTTLPQRLGQLKTDLTGRKLLDAKRLVAKKLVQLTQSRFVEQDDPWGNPWVPTKKVEFQRELMAEYGAAMASYNAQYAQWVAGGKKRGQCPKKPKKPQDRGGKTLSKTSQILVDTGALRRSFQAVKEGDTWKLTVRKKDGGGTADASAAAPGAATNMVYFPPHQFGWPEKNIPARPMLPIRGNAIDLPDKYRDAIDDVLKTWVETIVS